MWQPLFPGSDPQRPDHARHERRPPPDVRSASRCASCSTRHLGDALARAARRHRASWEGVREIPNEELWAARCEARGRARRATSASEAQSGQPAARRAARLRARDRDQPRPRRAHDRLRAPARHLQARLPAHPRPGPGAPHPLAAPRRCSSLDRRQGAPERRAAARTRSSASTASSTSDAEIAGRVVIVEDYDLGVARAARLRLRRLGQPAAQADGGERHERHEGDVQRRAPAQRARRLVGGGVRRRRTAGRSPATRTRPERRRRRATPRSSTTCSSTR